MAGLNYLHSIIENEKENENMLHLQMEQLMAADLRDHHLAVYESDAREAEDVDESDIEDDDSDVGTESIDLDLGFDDLFGLTAEASGSHGVCKECGNDPCTCGEADIPDDIDVPSVEECNEALTALDDMDFMI